MIITDRVAFIHIPRTGGHWVEGAMIGSGLKCRASTDRDLMKDPVAIHDVFPVTDYPGKLVFTFIRDPIAWLRSYWCYVQGAGINPESSVESFIGNLDLESFGEKILKEHPGMASKSFEQYIKKAGTGLYVGHTERLEEHLQQFLSGAKELYNSQVIKNLKPMNNSPKSFPHFSKDLTKKLRDSESWYYQQFDHKKIVRITELVKS